MEPYLQEQVRSLREEIMSVDAQMIFGSIILTLLTVLLYATAENGDDPIRSYKLVCVLAVSFGFFVARGDYLIHRAAGWIKKVEGSQARSSGVGVLPASWEYHKAHLRSTKIVMPVVDLLSVGATLWSVYHSLVHLWSNGDHNFVVFAVIGVVLAILSVPAAVKLATW